MAKYDARKFPLTLLIALFVGGFANRINAQMVTIPDANFAEALEFYFPACITGDQLDSQCPEVLNATSLSIGGNEIADLTGIECFVSLTYFACNQNSITSIPPLPAGLVSFTCFGNPLTTGLPALPGGLKALSCAQCNLTSLPALPAGLLALNCDQNQLTSLPVLPNGLETIHCNYNQLTSLPDLPDSLLNLQCTYNQLMSLPELPPLLYVFHCNNNQLTSIPELPSGIDWFSCHNNPDLTCLPALPNLMSYFGSPGEINLSNTQIYCLPNIPEFFAASPVSVCQTGGINNPNNCISVVGLSEETDPATEALMPFPNPVNTIFQFNLPARFNGTETTVFLYTLSGEKMAAYSINPSGVVSVDMENYDAGVYILKVVNGSETLTTRVLKN